MLPAAFAVGENKSGTHTHTHTHFLCATTNTLTRLSRSRLLSQTLFCLLALIHSQFKVPFITTNTLLLVISLAHTLSSTHKIHTNSFFPPFSSRPLCFFWMCKHTFTLICNKCCFYSFLIHTNTHKFISLSNFTLYTRKLHANVASTLFWRYIHNG